MSDSPRRILYLVVGKTAPPPAAASAEVFRLTPENAPAALEKIFAADTIAIWGEVRTETPSPH